MDPNGSVDEIQDFVLWRLDDIMCLFQNQQEHETKRTGIKSAASVQKANVSTTDGLSIQCYYNSLCHQYINSYKV